VESRCESKILVGMPFFNDRAQAIAQLTISEIGKLVLTNPLCDISDFSSPPWDETILVTPCDGVQTL